MRVAFGLTMCRWRLLMRHREIGGFGMYILFAGKLLRLLSLRASAITILISTRMPCPHATEPSL